MLGNIEIRTLKRATKYLIPECHLAICTNSLPLSAEQTTSTTVQIGEITVATGKGREGTSRPGGEGGDAPKDDEAFASLPMTVNTTFCHTVQLQPIRRRKLLFDAMFPANRVGLSSF